MMNASSFEFKNNSGEIQKYTHENCSAYGIDQMDAFERYEVSISQSKVAPNELSSGPDHTEIIDTVFLKVLQKGEHLTLFSYTDKIKERFYIREKENATPKELIRQIYLKPDESMKIITIDKYLQQLLMIVRKLKNGVSAEEGQLRRLDYKANSLKKLVAALNGQEVVKSKFPRSRFFVGAGVSLTGISYGGAHQLASGAVESKKSIMPYFNVGVDVFANPAVQRLTFRSSLSFYMSKNEISKTTSDTYNLVNGHTFDEKTVAFTPQIIYNIYNKEQFKAYLGFGAELSYSNFSNNFSRHKSSFGSTVRDNTVENQISLEKFRYSFPISAGVTLHKKIEIVAGYSLRSVLTKYVFYTVGLERYRIGVNYLFGKD